MYYREYCSKLILVVFILFFLSNCDSNSAEDMNKYIKAVKEKKIQLIEPLPEFTRISPYIRVEGANVKNPFVPKFTNNNIVKERINRIKNPLEMFALESLKMLGTVKAADDMWAIIQAPDNVAYKVKKGDYIGKQYGKITKITEKKIYVSELIPVYGGFGSKDSFLELME